MKPVSFLFLLTILSQSGIAQLNVNKGISGDVISAMDYGAPEFSNPSFQRKLYQRNHGIILGLQKGGSTAIELGGEAHWRKMSLRKPRIWGATVNMEYDFSNHVIGYKAGAWRKQGRINFTYGANLAWFTDFKGNSRYGINPAIGFRLAGFHLVNGYNLTLGDSEIEDINTLYLSLRYYFPLQNKFTWDRKTRKKMEQKRKDKEDRREARKKRREENPGSLRNIFKKKEKKETEEEKPKKKLFSF